MTGAEHPSNVARRPTAVTANRVMLVMFGALMLMAALLLEAPALPPAAETLLALVLSGLLMAGLFHRVLRDLIRFDPRWRTPPDWRASGQLALHALAVLVGLFVFFWSVLPEPWWPSPLQQPSYRGAGDFAWYAVMTLVVTPVVEGLVFYGVVLRGYEHARGPRGATVVFAVVYGLYYSNALTVIASTLNAWMAARTVQRTNSVWTAVLAASWMGIPYLLLSAASLSTLLDSFAQPPLWLGVLGLLVGSASFLLFRRRDAPQEDYAAPRRPPFVSASLVLLAVLMLPAMAFSTRGLNLPEVEQGDERPIWPPRLSRDVHRTVVIAAPEDRRVQARQSAEQLELALPASPDATRREQPAASRGTR